MSVESSPLQTRETRIARLRAFWREVVRGRWGYLFISPFFILFAIFGAGPLLFSIILSFVKWDGFGPMELVGLKNFTHLFGPGGTAFWESIRNGVFIFFLHVPVMVFLSLVLAVILNSKLIRFYQGFRTMYFAPYVTSMIAAGITFRLLFATKDGLFNIFLEMMQLSGIPWLDDPWWARVSLTILIWWGYTGYNMVWMLSGLQTIPREITEAAMIDGANAVQTFFRITVPLMRPVIIFVTIFSTMGSFALFDQVRALFNMTGGSGPMRSTLTTVLQIFNVAFGNHRFGRASAQAYVYFGLIFVLTILQFRYFGREER